MTEPFPPMRQESGVTVPSPFAPCHPRALLCGGRQVVGGQGPHPAEQGPACLMEAGVPLIHPGKALPLGQERG